MTATSMLLRLEGRCIRAEWVHEEGLAPAGPAGYVGHAHAADDRQMKREYADDVRRAAPHPETQLPLARTQSQPVRCSDWARSLFTI